MSTANINNLVAHSSIIGIPIVFLGVVSLQVTSMCSGAILMFVSINI